MEMMETFSMAGIGALVVVAIWFGRSPAMRRARTGSNGGPTMYWWASFCVAVVLGAFIANHY